MTRRLPGACVGAALVAVLMVSARAAAKPPDLPQNEKITVAPRVAPEIDPPADPTAAPTAPVPVRAHPLLGEMKIEINEGNTGELIFGVGVNSNAGLTGSITVNERNFDVMSRVSISNVVRCLAQELLPSGPSIYEILPNAVPTPTLYQLRPTARRSFAGSILFGLHPLLALLPTDKALDAPHDHPQHVAGDDVLGDILSDCYVPGMESFFSSVYYPSHFDLLKLMKSFCSIRHAMPSTEENEGYVYATGDAEIDAPLVPGAEALPMPKEDKPHKKKHKKHGRKGEQLPMPREDTAEGVTCPYLRQQMMDRHVTQTADPDIGRDVLDNLQRLKEADGLVELAEELARAGYIVEALACCAHAQSLCPGSPCAHRAADVMLNVCLGAFPSKSGTEEAAEERAPADEKPCKKRSREEQNIEKKLATPVSLNFTNTPLRQVIDDLRAYQGVNIYVDEPALAEKGIDPNQPVTIKLDRIALKSALNLLLHSAHLTFVVKEDVLVITTEEHAHGKLENRVYNVADLVGHKALPKGCTPPGRKAKQSAEDRLIELLTTTVAPRSWSEQGGPGTIDYFPLTCSLVVNQTADVQDQVADLLAALRRFYDKEEPGAREPGVEQQVHGLMKACRLLVEEGLHHQAAELARQAYALDPASVEADPLVYKMHLLADTPASPPSAGEASEPPSCPYCPRTGEPIREIVPEKMDESGPATLLVPPMPPVDYEIVPALDRVLTEGAEEASEPVDVPSGIAELIDRITGGPGETLLGVGFNGDGSLRVGGECRCGGTVYHVLLSKGCLAVWKTPDARKLKP